MVSKIFKTYFQSAEENLSQVSMTCVLESGHVLGFFVKCLWILGCVLDSGKCLSPRAMILFGRK